MTGGGPCGGDHHFAKPSCPTYHASMPESPRTVFQRWLDAVERQDHAALRSMLHPDYIDEIPQTGERTRGAENALAILTNYPGAAEARLALTDTEVHGADDQWVVAPNFTVIQVVGTDQVYTATSRVRYPDGSHWYMIALVRMKDGLVHRTTTFYAPEMPAPEWRAAWVERMERPKD
jgi:hypothetical protein